MEGDDETTPTLAAIALLAAPAVAEDLKLADFQPPTHFVVDTTYKPFADAIAEATGGDVTVTLYRGGELGPGPGEQYNRVVDGVADIAFSLPGYTASTFPKTLLTELPGVITAETGTERILDNLEMLSDEYRRVILVGLWNNAPVLLFMADKPVRSMEDLRGLKMRVPSRDAGLLVQAWEGKPGVDASAGNSQRDADRGDRRRDDRRHHLGAFRLGEVTKYITQGIDTTISSFFLIMNRDSFNDLTEKQQQAVLDAGRDASRNGSAAWLAVADKAPSDFAATEGKEVITLSPEEAEKFNTASAAVVEQVIAKAEAEGIEAQAFIDLLRGE
jgi:TRAP-type transport system periplasmic protein